VIERTTTDELTVRREITALVGCPFMSVQRSDMKLWVKGTIEFLLVLDKHLFFTFKISCYYIYLDEDI
jgi:hypothetical protein